MRAIGVTVRAAGKAPSAPGRERRGARRSPIGAVVLAAGGSRLLGTPKQLMAIDQRRPPSTSRQQ